MKCRKIFLSLSRFVGAISVWSQSDQLFIWGISCSMSHASSGKHLQNEEPFFGQLRDWSSAKSATLPVNKSRDRFEAKCEAVKQVEGF